MDARFGSAPLYVSWYTSRGLASFVLPLYFSSRGIPVIEIGVALGLVGAGVMIFEVTWGFVIDRFGVARTFPVVAIVAAATFVFLPAVDNTWEAYFASFLVGMTSPFMIVMGRSLTVGQSESTGWGSGFGVLGAAVSLGFGVGALLGGFGISSFGFGVAFYVAAVLSAVSIPLYFGVSTRGVRLRSVGDGRLNEESAKERFDWRSFIILSVVSVPLFMGAAFFTSLMQLVVTQTPTIGAGTNEASVLVAIMPLSNVVFQPLLGWKLGGRATTFIAVGLALNGGVFVLLMLATSMPEFYLLALAEGFCFAMISPLSLSLLMVGTHKKYSGRVMGAYGSAEDVGTVVGPVVGAFAWATYGLNWAYLAMGVPMFAVLVFYLGAYRMPGRRSQSATLKSGRF